MNVPKKVKAMPWPEEWKSQTNQDVSEMTIFKLHFEQGQASINKMTECIEKMMEAGDSEGAGKLRNALAALLTTTLEVLK